MKLTVASLRRYRSIEQIDPFEIEPQVTSLVGKNESGKTAVLQALYKAHPVDNATYDEGIDYPSRLTRERKGSDKIPVAGLTYALDDDDVQAVEAVIGEGALSSRTVTVTTGYRYSSTEWSVGVSQKAVVKSLKQDLDLPQVTKKQVDAAGTVAELVAALEEMEAPTSAVTAALARTKKWRRADAALAAVDILSARRPEFVYFGDYDSMPGIVSIPDLIAKRDENELTRGEQAVLALLDMAGVALEDFKDPQSYEHMVRDLENASNSISDEVFEYWSQNKNLSVRLDIIGSPEPGAVAPYDQAPLLQIRVVNNRHNVSVPFDERSRGFVWFFSFLAYFTHLEENTEKPLILLLDEPGLNLHATAQADLLRFIDERLAPSHQVLFSTHSPFMINAHAFNRVRTVVDDEKSGTVVSADVFKADSETTFPLHAALGIELSQTLYVGPHVLLVEGPGDVLYLEVLSNTLKQQGRVGLDDRLTITPGGGITKLPAFVTLFGANKLNTIVLIDSSSANAPAIQRLREAGKLGSGGIVEVGTALGETEADIEDLFEPDFFVELVNDAYQGLLKSKKLTVKELPADTRLIRRVERAFESRGLNQGRINHFAPASALARNETKYTATLGARTLDAAEAMFAQINALVK